MKRQRQEIEDAISALSALLDRSDCSESECQQLFESHQIIWEVLGYDKAIPHPQLWGGEDDLDIPDFLAHHRLGRWEIVELKTPSASITKEPRKRKSNVRANARDSISQALDYAERVSDPLIRKKLLEEYQVDFGEFPRVTIVAGGGAHFDRRGLEKELRRVAHPIEWLSYHDILIELYRFRSIVVGSDENQQGLVLYFVFLPGGSSSSEQRLISIGPCGVLEGAEVFTNNTGAVRATIKLRDGNNHSVSVPPVMGSANRKPMGMLVEFIPCRDRTLFSLQINGIYEACERYEITQWEPSSSYPIVIGDNEQTDASCWFDLIEHAIWSVPVPLTRRRQFWKDVYDSLVASWSPRQPRIRFKGRQFFRNSGHPHFEPEPGGAPGDLIQPIKEFQPMMWPINPQDPAYVTRLYDQSTNQPRF